MLQSELVSVLKKECNSRTEEDVHVLFSFLRGLDCVSSLPDAALERLCQLIRFESHPAGATLYGIGDKADCWYILISGNVFIDGIMYVPPSSFGKRVKSCGQRQASCVVLDDSEFIVIDYRSHCHNDTEPNEQRSSLTLSGSGAMANEAADDSEELLKPGIERWIVHRSSDTSTLRISNEVPYPVTKRDSKSLLEDCPNFDFLKETSVDSDAEDSGIEAYSPLLVQDTVKDCLDKQSKERSEDDIEVILNFMQHFPAFSNMTVATRREICAVVAFALIESANTTIYTNGQEFDSWSVIINGEVEILRPDGSTDQLHVGDSFGLQPNVSQTADRLRHSGIMYTKVDNCQFVCIAKEDFYKILHQGAENTEKLEEYGKVVVVTEKRPMKKGNKTGIVVIRASPEKLISHLLEEQSSADPTYAEDFLLTSRTFLKSTMDLVEPLSTWLQSDIPAVRQSAVRVILLWVNNHFSDFEFSPGLNDFYVKFENYLTSMSMEGQLKLLKIACSIKSHLRRVAVTRVNLTAEWPFTTIPGSGTGGSLYVQSVTEGIGLMKSDEGVLLRGDQILDVNGCNTESMSYKQFLKLLKSSEKLELTVRFNIDAFREIINTIPPASNSDLKITNAWKRSSLGNDEVKLADGKGSGGAGSGIYFSPRKIGKVIQPLFRNNAHKSNQYSEFSTDLPGHRSASGHPLHSSGSHPDLTSVGANCGTADQLIKIYMTNQASKKLLVSKVSTVAEVVAMAVKEFGLQNPSSYCLCEEVLDDKMEAKLTILPSHLINAMGAGRSKSKFYLITCAEGVDVPRGCSPELTWLNDYQSGLLQLQPEELAKQLTTRDLLIFKDIESTEYVVDLFDLQSNYGTTNLKKFTKVVNDEMFWVMTEICIEGSVDNRAKLMQKFIKIAKLCKEASNFNSTFFIVSGLSHAAISRLKLSWERVPTKYNKLFKSMQDLLDPSRNMSNYRNLLNSQLSHSPAIPFFPIVKKDLTFIHLGNDSKVEGLINFEKLRMVAKEVRRVTNMASSYYHNFLEESNASTSVSETLPSHSSSSVSVFGTLRRKKPLPVRLNSRRLLDEAQMVQRVKAYLSNMRIITDEEKLIEMSNQLEPSANARRKPVSPLPPPIDAGVTAAAEAKSSAISGPKFGTSSTQAVQKLMALTDKVKPHDQRKHPVPSAPLPLEPRSGSLQPKSRQPIPVHLSVESSSVVGPGHGSATQSRTGGATRNLDVTNFGSRANSHSRQGSLPDQDTGSSLASTVSDTISVSSGKYQNFVQLSSAQLKRGNHQMAPAISIEDHPRLLRFPRGGLPSSAPVSPCHQTLQTVSHENQGSESSSLSTSFYPSQKTQKRILAADVPRDDLSDEELLVTIV